MASQALLFAETIAGMKKAIKRKAYDTESDSDNSTEPITNRGNKLKKRARFVREGQLAPPNGLDLYKRSIVHAGFRRDVISRNPPLVDEDGYEIDSDDDEERREDAIAAAAEFDPYADIRIEQLLAPLTAASDLPNHPTLSYPFYSKQLTELTNHARDMVQKEAMALWRMRHLLTRLSGDHTWVPCELVESDNSFALISEGKNNLKEKRTALTNGEKRGTAATRAGQMEPVIENITEDVAMADTAASDQPNGNGMVTEPTSKQGDQDVSMFKQEMGTDTVEVDKPADKASSKKGESEEDPGVDAPVRMRTRAQGQPASENSALGRGSTPDSADEPYIHPYFLAPPSSFPDRDFGLPSQEAEELRRLVQMYIQKQEEVCRGVQTLYDKLLKADRMRHEVLKWSKAEAHVGEMSDGEDWYDKEEWGLDADLKKGQDDEEEDTTTTQKKTRTRRQ